MIDLLDHDMYIQFPVSNSDNCLLCPCKATIADQHGNASISAATKPKVVITQPFIELPEMTRTLHEHQLFDEVCFA